MIKGLLIDMDGVLYVEDRVVPGAPETITWLRRQNLPFRFLTNTTMKSRVTLAAKLNRMGIEVEPAHIFSAVYAAACYVRQKPGARCHLMLAEDAQQEFAGLASASDQVDFVVAGDLGDQLNYDRINRAFRCLMNGAELVALQKNRFWRTADGLAIDAGAFVAALEYASGKTATLIGKPARPFFEAALQDMDITAAEALVIGDDLEADIQGAQALGIRAALVMTGKSQPDDVAHPTIRPDFIFSTIADFVKFKE